MTARQPDRGLADTSRISTSNVCPLLTARDIRGDRFDMGYVTGPNANAVDGSSATSSIVSVPLAGEATCRRRQAYSRSKPHNGPSNVADS